MRTRLQFYIVSGLILFATHALSQNVGIGIPVPEELLHLRGGNLRIDYQNSLIFDADNGDTSGVRFFTSGLPKGALLYSAEHATLNLSRNDTITGLFYDFNADKAFIGRDHEINSLEKFGISTTTPMSGFGGMYMDVVGQYGIRPFYGYSVQGVVRADHYYDAAGKRWVLRVGGSKMAVDSISGNVGIGTLVPSNKLHVMGPMASDATIPELKLLQSGSTVGSIRQDVNNLKIENIESGRLALINNGIEGVTLNFNGYVGLGVLTPLEKLHVIGNLRLEDSQPSLKMYTAGSQVSDIVQVGDNLRFRNLQNGSFVFYNNGLNRMIIDNVGRVGIGISTISERLHVGGTVASDVASSPEFSLMQSGVKVASLTQFINDTRVENLESGKVFLWTDGLPRLTAHNNGNIGIGTTEPADRLHVDGGDFRLDNGVVTTFKIYNGPTYRSYLQQNGLNLSLASRADGGSMFFKTEDVVRMKIDQDGNVGIGVLTPASKLDVDGSVRFDSLGVGIDAGDMLEKTHIKGPIRVDNIGSTLAQLNLYAGATHVGQFQANTNNVFLRNLGLGDIYFWTGGQNRAILTDVGKFGVGTTNPQAELHVLGTARFETPSPSIQFIKDGIFAGVISQIDSNYLIQNYLPGKMKLLTNGTLGLSIGENGNVGVGVHSPGEKLHVRGSIRIDDPTTPQLQLRQDTSLAAYLKSSGNDLYVSNKLSGSLRLLTEDTTRIVIWDNGNVQIDGNTLRVNAATDQVVIGNFIAADGYKLNVDGKIIAEEIKVQLSQNWPDYVFDDGYNLMSLEETENFINSNGHLPGVPSEADVTLSGGVELGEMNRILLEKVEELTLLIIDQQKKIDALDERIKSIEN